MKSFLRWIVLVVLATDAAAAAALLVAAVLDVRAATGAAAATARPAEATRVDSPREAQATPGPEVPPGPENARPMGRSEEPTSNEAALASIADIPAVEEPEAGPLAARKADAFRRLLRTYENMEPESAAKALAALAERDLEVVVELLMGFKPRSSGAILDALTQKNAALAADLSYEIWRRSGEEPPGAADSGR
jgi:hypothetical protein